MKAGARISIASQGQEQAKVEQPSRRVLSCLAVGETIRTNNCQKYLATYRAEGPGGGGAESKSGGPDLGGDASESS